LHDVLLKH